jgi:hypothetical protein
MRNLMLALTLAIAWSDAYAQSPAPTRYTLVEVRGKALPATVETELRCREDVTAATLSLSGDGRWLLETATKEICGDRTEEDSDRDHGTYTMEGQKLSFRDDDGRENHDSGSGVGQTTIWTSSKAEPSRRMAV